MMSTILWSVGMYLVGFLCGAFLASLMSGNDDRS